MQLDKTKNYPETLEKILEKIFISCAIDFCNRKLFLNRKEERKKCIIIYTDITKVLEDKNT